MKPDTAKLEGDERIARFDRRLEAMEKALGANQARGNYDIYKSHCRCYISTVTDLGGRFSDLGGQLFFAALCFVLCALCFVLSALCLLLEFPVFWSSHIGMKVLHGA
jgi:hypothetical protein